MNLQPTEIISPDELPSLVQSDIAVIASKMHDVAASLAATLPPAIDPADLQKALAAADAVDAGGAPIDPEASIAALAADMDQLLDFALSSDDELVSTIAEVVQTAFADLCGVEPGGLRAEAAATVDMTVAEHPELGAALSAVTQILQAALSTTEVDFRPEGMVSARASAERAVNFQIPADIAENEAYKLAIDRGEIGIAAPLGVNAAGPDFITAIPGADGMQIILTDVKSSSIGQFPKERTNIPESWLVEARAVIEGFGAANPNLAEPLIQAFEANRIERRQIEVDRSPTPEGQGRIFGFDRDNEVT